MREEKVNAEVMTASKNLNGALLSKSYLTAALVAATNDNFASRLLLSPDAKYALLR
ncbi:hypothetical protein LOAG_14873 [Loa loa]|uniref:Uncharacterized protein n=1 Tax=Loa loa TaxID=7209 RepID=A0A1S0TGZ9_LOALO|nr:hypothetical protein LOAG_14873 [Loa loa]EFO13656.1 hypothetical protein LOAG_14873 [Loa loa]